jgi:mediator of RNA polymerase II transcription subunit 18
MCFNSRSGLDAGTNHSRFTGESIEEGYRFVHEHVVMYITRILRIPEESQEEEYKGKPKINKTLPPFENLSLYDAQNKWVMTISLQVLAASDLENMQKGTEELMKIKADLEGLFDLQIRDRHVFDTRVRA